MTTYTIKPIIGIAIGDLVQVVVNEKNEKGLAWTGTPWARYTGYVSSITRTELTLTNKDPLTTGVIRSLEEKLTVVPTADEKLHVEVKLISSQH